MYMQLSVQVSKHDARDLERKLRKELFNKWEEKVEVLKRTKIPVEKITEYLDYMENSYEGKTIKHTILY